MSTPQEYQAARAEVEELRAELALVSEQHAAACAKYDALRGAVEYEIVGCDHAITLPMRDEWDHGYRAGAKRSRVHLLSLLVNA
jgi:hypothetical protein